MAAVEVEPDLLNELKEMNPFVGPEALERGREKIKQLQACRLDRLLLFEGTFYMYEGDEPHQLQMTGTGYFEYELDVNTFISPQGLLTDDDLQMRLIEKDARQN